MIEITAQKQSAAKWGGNRLHWSEIYAVRSRLNAKVSGDPEVNWVRYSVEKHLAGLLPLERCLILAWGEGQLERRLARMGVFQACDAYYVSLCDLAEARESAARDGFDHITYRAADVNTLEPPSGTYDVVWLKSAMVFSERPEHTCTQLVRCLKPGGLVILNEYVGPSRFQFPDRQKQIIRSAFALLPERYRRPMMVQAAQPNISVAGDAGWRWYVKRVSNKVLDGDLMPALRRRWIRQQAARNPGRISIDDVTFPTGRDMIAADPSLAAQSAGILDAVAQHFRIIERRDLGGALLQFLFEGIAGNFMDGKPETSRWLDLMFELEDALMESGELGSDFVYLVARRP